MISEKIKKILVGIVFLYVVALHSSIAGMEIFSWAMCAFVIGYKVITRSKFSFPLYVPLLGLLLSVTASLLANTMLRPFLFQFGFMRWMILLWVFYWTFETIWDERFEMNLIRVWSGVFIAMAILAVVQFFTGFDPRPGNHWVEHQDMVYRAPGFFSNCLTFVGVAGVSYFGVLMPALKHLRFKGHRPVMLILGPAAIIASMTRGGVIALLAASFSYFASVKRKWLPYFGAATIGGVIVLAMVSTKMNNILHMRLENSSSERLHIWRSYAQMAIDHPFKGVGLLQGDLVLPEYYQRLGIVEEFKSHAHNVLLQWAGGAGLIALFFYLWLSFALLKMSWSLRKVSPWGWSLFMAQVFVHVAGLTEANFFDGEVNHMLMFVWALTLFHFVRQNRSVPSC